MDVVKLEDFCHLNLGNVTFAVRCARASLAVVWRSWAGDVLTACAPPLQEAYQKTGRIINIFLTHTPHKGYPSLLNHLVSLALSPGPCCIFALDLFLFWSNALSPSAAPPLQTTPNVLLYSAAAAACAQPGMYEPVELVAKDIDGKIVPLLPAQGASAKSWSSKTVHLVSKTSLSCSMHGSMTTMGVHTSSARAERVRHAASQQHRRHP